MLHLIQPQSGYDSTSCKTLGFGAPASMTLYPERLQDGKVLNKHALIALWKVTPLRQRGIIYMVDNAILGVSGGSLKFETKGSLQEEERK